MISVPTQRFGVIERPTQDVLTFPGGIFGFELQMRWMLLGDREYGGLYWLQNIEQPDLSLSVVEPREFVRGYSLHVKCAQLASVWNGTDPLIVLSVLTEYESQLCLNLRNPFVINPETRLGRQVVVADDQPIQHVLSAKAPALKQSA